MTRRILLQRLLVILGIDPAGLMRSKSAHAVNAASLPDPAVFDPPLKTGTLSRAEMEDLIAFAEVLVEGRRLTLAERKYLVEHIEERTKRTTGYLALYQLTVSTLRRLVGRRFGSLEISKRIDLVARHRLGTAQVWPGEDLGPFPEGMRAIRTRAVPDLIGGYYGSPAGWAVVGYTTFPGRCEDLTRYVRAES